MNSINASDFDFVRELVRRSAAIVLESDKQYLVESRLSPLAQREGFQSLSQLLTQVRRQPDSALGWKVVAAMTTNETSFFRDIHPFEALRRAVLPALLARREATRRLDLWCAACSTGQEPYSIAMLLTDAFPVLSKGWVVTVLASDLNEDVLERARAGRFSQVEVNRGVPAAYLVKYFRRTGAEWQLKDEILRRVTFRSLNLARPWADLPPMDVVFLRNVLIYFDQETKRDILGRVRQLLRPDGYLFVGGTESTIHIDCGYAPVAFEKSVYFQVRGAEDEPRAPRPSRPMEAGDRARRDR